MGGTLRECDMTVDPLPMAIIMPPPDAPDDDGNISGLPPPPAAPVMLPAGDETDGCIRPPVAAAAADSGCRKLRLDSVVDDTLLLAWFWFCAMHRVRISGNSSSCRESGGKKKIIIIRTPWLR